MEPPVRLVLTSVVAFGVLLAIWMTTWIIWLADANQFVVMRACLDCPAFSFLQPDPAYSWLKETSDLVGYFTWFVYVPLAGIVQIVSITRYNRQLVTSCVPISA